jgi:hypothetical protein
VPISLAATSPWLSCALPIQRISGLQAYVHAFFGLPLPGHVVDCLLLIALCLDVVAISYETWITMPGGIIRMSSAHSRLLSGMLMFLR